MKVQSGRQFQTFFVYKSADIAPFGPKFRKKQDRFPGIPAVRRAGKSGVSFRLTPLF
jgi:hypothetical protein